MADVRVGLLGCGRIAQLVHLGVLTSLRGARLVALAELDPERREQARRRAPQAAAVAEYERVLERPDVDAVVICLPNALHAEAARLACSLGRHVYLEKPLALSVGEGRTVVSEWRRAGVIGMIGFNYRFNALVRAARDRMQAGALGGSLGARAVFSTRPRPSPTWKSNRALGGGVLLDYGSHVIDTIRFVLNQEVRQISARLGSRVSPLDSAFLELSLADGLMVQSFILKSGVEEDRLEIYGEKGKLTVDRHRSLDIELTRSSSTISRARWRRKALGRLLQSGYARKKLIAPRSEPSYRAALGHFVAAILDGHPASPDFLDGLRSLAVLEAAERSESRRKRIDLVDEDPAP